MRLVLRGDETVSLTPKCFEILLALVESSGEVVSKDELMKQVWPDSFVEEGNLTYNISILRKTLGERAGEHHYIVTAPGQGYRFIADVKDVSDGPGEAKSSALQAPALAQRIFSNKFAIIALLFVALSGFLIYWMINHPKPGWATVPGSTPAANSIAVLPFELVGAEKDSEAEYLSDGISESLINSLSQFPALKVIARNSSFRYKGKNADPQEVAKALVVEMILTGRVAQRGDGLLISVELMDARSGTQIWGEQYNRKASDLLAVRQELARDITERLRLRLRGEDEKRLTRGDAGNTEAYGFYLKGRHFWNRRTAANLKKAIEQFQHAIERDPNYALAYIGLADGYVLLEEYGSTPSSESLPKARAAVQQAFHIDESLAEAHAAMGLIEQNSWNFSEAEREHKRAIELNPNYAAAHAWYGFYLRVVRGRFDEAMAEIRLAQQLEPQSPIIGTSLAQVFINKGELNAAIEEAKKVLELDPNFPLAYGAVGVVYQKQGRYEEAIAELEKAAELSGGWSLPLAHLGVCYAVAGKRDRARATLKELEEKYGRREALGQHVAGLYAALGDKDQAFAWLEKDFQARSGLLPWIAYEPWSDTLRDALSSDPRWNDLLRRIGLSQN
jgi:TolB-like protein/DNA-binding winged helix-turn-helix (wHTH) protein/Flp pilus assembly protein TadD